jgi:hypothetical protein
MERRTKKVGAIEASWGETRQPLGVVVGVAFLDILNKSSRRFQDQIKFFAPRQENIADVPFLVESTTWGSALLLKGS